jgi:choline kinase
MKAVVLAAGKNIRLRSVTRNPKTLLKIGENSLLDRIALACRKYGIPEMVIVVGYSAEAIERHINENPLTFGELDIKTIFNSEYDTTNNIYSFWLARKEMNEPFILFNSDVLFHEGILRILLENTAESALAVDDVKVLGIEEMKVIMNDKGLITDISKEIDPSEAHGEYIGIAKFFDSEVTDRILSKIKFLIDQGRTDVFYEEAFRLLSKETPCIYGVSTKGLPWIEIDTPEDYEKALREILPRIQNWNSKTKN